MQSLSTYAHASSLMLITSDCDLNIGLTGNENCYDSVGGVTILPCIEVCFSQALVTYFTKDLVPFSSYSAYCLVVARVAILLQSGKLLSLQICSFSPCGLIGDD